MLDSVVIRFVDKNILQLFKPIMIQWSKLRVLLNEIWISGGASANIAQPLLCLSACAMVEAEQRILNKNVRPKNYDEIWTL